MALCQYTGWGRYGTSNQQSGDNSVNLGHLFRVHPRSHSWYDRGGASIVEQEDSQVSRTDRVCDFYYEDDETLGELIAADCGLSDKARKRHGCPIRVADPIADDISNFEADGYSASIHDLFHEHFSLQRLRRNHILPACQH